MILDQLKLHAMTCMILTLYLANIVWYLFRNQWGLALYWAAASVITVSATWLRGWES